MIEKTKIFNAECIEFMKGKKDGFYDVAIVDPPYGIGQTWSKSVKDKFYQKGKLHLGSGSSAIAAMGMGFDYEGCETDQKYFIAAKRRIKDEESQQKLNL